MLTVPIGLNGIIETFGDVTQYIKNDGIISQKEEKEFLTVMPLPFSMTYAYDTSITITKIRCHKLMVEPFTAVFADILDSGLNGYCKEYGGCYNFRSKRTSSKLSTHSWGIAIDLNPRTNAMGTIGDMNKEVVNIFKKYGFIWGGNWKTPDPMHFQYARGY